MVKTRTDRVKNVGKIAGKSVGKIAGKSVGKNKVKPIVTPKGAKLGDPTMIDGKPGLHYKAGKKEEDLTPEQLVECITKRKVAKIVYMQPEPVLQCM